MGAVLTCSAQGVTGRTSQLLAGMVRVVWGRICGPEHQKRRHSDEKELQNLHRSPLEVLFSRIPNGCVEGKPLLRLGRKTTTTITPLGKNNYYGVVSKTVPTAHPWLRSNHIPTNQIEKSSLNTQNIQKRPDYSDSLKLCKSEDNGKIFKLLKEKNNLKTGNKLVDLGFYTHTNTFKKKAHKNVFRQTKP